MYRLLYNQFFRFKPDDIIKYFKIENLIKSESD